MRGATPCPLCGEIQFRTVYWLRDNRTAAYDGRFREVRCQNCGLVGLRPLPDELELLGGYERGYGPYRIPHPKRSHRMFRYARVTRFLDTLRRYWHILDGNATIDRVKFAGAVLDLGAGQGDNLEYLARRGYQAVGIEPNPLAAAICVQKGLAVFCGTLDSVHLEPEAFDTVILSQVVEHLLDPRRSLDSVFRILRPGGRVVIFTPNPQGLPARLFGSNWGHWHVPYHVYLYGPAQIRTLLRSAGLSVELLRTVSPAYWLNMSFKLWRHASQRTGWTLPAGGWQPHIAARLAMAPLMRSIDLMGMGDCLVAIGVKK